MTGFDATREPANPINSVYLAYGGAAGVLGLPAGEEEDTAGARSPGRRRHYAQLGAWSGTRDLSCPRSARGWSRVTDQHRPRKSSSPRFPGARGRVRTSCTDRFASYGCRWAPRAASSATRSAPKNPHPMDAADKAASNSARSRGIRKVDRSSPYPGLPTRKTPTAKPRRRNNDYVEWASTRHRVVQEDPGEFSRVSQFWRLPGPQVVTCGDRRYPTARHDHGRVASPALPDLQPAPQLADAARPRNLVQGHRAARAAPRGRRTPQNQPEAAPGLGRPSRCSPR